MGDTTVVILGGGQGSRLFPLTKNRSKPAVPLAGKYRIIDIPVSNSIHSGLKRIFVLTQFNSASLNRHVTRTYRFDTFSDGFVEILAAEQTDEHRDWFQGTADAVRKHFHRFKYPRTERVVILSGDQLYRMDYREMLRRHDEAGANATVAVLPVRRDQASSYGILKIDEAGRIREFFEKPSSPEDLDAMESPRETLDKLGFTDPKRTYLASMGIYTFDIDALEAGLADENAIDFGRDVLPHMIKSHKVYAYIFDGYWEDIGTIRAFYEANLDLVSPTPKFHFYRSGAPIYSRPRFLPASKLYDCKVHNSAISEGCLVRESVIDTSIIGIRTLIDTGSVIRRSIVMGADFYPTSPDPAETRGLPPLGIGQDVVIENAIIDKNARIGRGVIIRNEARVNHKDGDCYYIRDGIVVIPKHGVVPDHTII